MARGPWQAGRNESETTSRFGDNGGRAQRGKAPPKPSERDMPTTVPDLSRLLDELAAAALLHAARLDEPLTVTLLLTPPGPDREAGVRAVVRREAGATLPS